LRPGGPRNESGVTAVVGGRCGCFSTRPFAHQAYTFVIPAEAGIQE